MKMPVFETERASRISSRFSSSIIVSNEVINGEDVTVFRSKQSIPYLKDQVFDYYCANFQVKIFEFECDENGTVLKFKLD
ncbi:hypothetical protein HMPREF0476_1463 [Kingella kingae ATCC 23330]|uniref:Uncharacterized protein n=3 Tax=Kingella TaxID=32257 RepID=F5S8D0_KINKI|nr:hypothetical protein HMPREF0476_1463 [Kingella kingae ATCC 23330]